MTLMGSPINESEYHIKDVPLYLMDAIRDCRAGTHGMLYLAYLTTVLIHAEHTRNADHLVANNHKDYTWLGNKETKGKGVD